MTIGNFDGVHLGHQAIVSRCGELAREKQVAVKALTFDPHPASVLRPGREPLRLIAAPRKRELLLQAGADEVVILEPTPAMLSLEPHDFVARLVADHHPIAVVEGIDFRFGRGRAGDVKSLAALGDEFGFATHVVPDVQVALSDHLLAPVSSSLIRMLLANGRVMDAALASGRAYELTGNVVQGDRRGRTLDMPTANLDAAATIGRALPGDGVYAGAVELRDGSEHPAAISIGVKPTFAGRRRTIEAHLLDYAGDLYGQTITLRFHRWLREQQPFPSPDALKAQLHRDVAQVRDLVCVGVLAQGRHNRYRPQ